MPVPARSRSFAVAAALLGASAAALADQHAVFSLVDNRPLAHLQSRGGLYIDAGGAGMARYVHFSRPTPSWKLGAREDGRRVALATAQAVLEVPLTADQAAMNVVWIGLKAPARSTVRVIANGKGGSAAPARSAPLRPIVKGRKPGKRAPVAHVPAAASPAAVAPSAAAGPASTSPTATLQPGWQVVKVELTPGALVAGENRLVLNFAQSGILGGQRAYAAVEFIQIGGAAPAQADPAMKGNSLSLPAGSGMAWFAFIPEGAALTAGGDAGGCKVAVSVDGADAGELTLDGAPLSLAAHQGHFARLQIGVTTQCGTVTLNRADLVAAGAAPTPPPRQPPKNVILWVSDSTRADKWTIYNPDTRVETPFMTELAKVATVFSSAYVQGNESRVSHASLFTSMYPSVHQMISDKAHLNAAFTILPEAVRPSQRWVGGVMGNGYIDNFWGFGDGWDFLHNHIHSTVCRVGGTCTKQLSDGGLSGMDLLSESKKLMAQRGANPFFLYVGSIDAHVSWRAHEPWISKYDPTPYKGPFVKACLDPQLDEIIGGRLKITERDRVRVQALYDSDISYTDQVLRRLFDNLKAHGHENDTMVIFTADHGEEMWDHGKVGHGQSLHEELVHVPLVIYYPPYFPGGKVIPEGVEVLDVLPTITDALEVPAPEAAQGESLMPLAAGVGAGYPRPAIASQYELAHAMRLGGFKLRVGGSGDARLYDVATDAHEDHDLWASRPAPRRALTDALGLWMANRNHWKKRRWGVASNLKPEFAADLGM